MSTRIASIAIAAIALAAIACSAADPSSESSNHLGSGDAAADEGDSGSGDDDASTGGDGATDVDSGTGAHNDSGSHSDSGTQHDSGTAADSGGHDAATLGAFGASCAVDGDCASGLCRGFRQMTVNFCTKACTAGTQAADCPSPPSAGTCNGMGYCKFN